MEYNQMLGMPQPVGAEATVAPTAPYVGMTSGLPPEVEAMHRPPASPEEFETRKTIWGQVAEKIQTNPNLQRALMLFAQHAASPMNGNTPAGHFIGAVNTGMTGYEFGQETAYQRELEAAKQRREQEAHDVNVEGVRTQTKGRQISNEVAEATKADAIRRVSVELQKLDQEVRTGALNLTKAEMELERAQRVKRITDTIPDTTIKASIEAEYLKAPLENKRIQAQTAQAGAAAGASAATTKVRNKELEAMDGLTGDDLRNYLNKTGKFAHANSAQVAALNAYLSHWEKSNPKSAEETTEAYDARRGKAATDFMTVQKQPSDEAGYLNYLRVTGAEDNEATRKQYQEWKQSMRGWAGEIPPGNTKGGAASGVVTRRRFNEQGDEVTPK